MIDPARIKKIYNKIALRFMMIFNPPTTPRLVAGPEIIKASKVPSLAPASLKTDKSGTTVASEM